MTHRLHVLIAGRVQGVGFRFATCDKAESLGLTGWVRNCGDGRVEAEFEGERTLLDEMLQWCHLGPPGARVQEVESTWETGESGYRGFDVRH